MSISPANSTPMSMSGRELMSPGFLPQNFSLPLAKADPTAAPVYQATRVNSAFAKLRNVFFQPRLVWNSELKEISASFGRLSPLERQSLVNLLARAPDAANQSLLSRWLERATDQSVGAFDGLDQKGRTQLWNQLVVGQDAKNLVRIFNSVGVRKTASVSADEANRIQFAQAVAKTGTAQQKIDFVGELRRDAINGSQDATSNTSGRAIAHVMTGTNDPATLKGYFNVLGRQGLDVVVEASVPMRDVAQRGSVAASVGMESIDTQLFQKLASVMSRSGNPREKAGFVAASGKVIDNLNTNVVGPNLRRKELGEVSRAVSTVIGTDTTSIIENVMLQNTMQGRSSGPAALKSYVQALLDSGKGAADIGAITLQLQRGNNLREDPLKYLAHRESRSGEPPTYVRARVMGGWLGLVGAGVQSRIGKRDSNAAFSSLLFTGGVDALKELVGARFPGLKVALGVATPALKTSINLGLLNWRNEATKIDRSFAQGLIEGALPRYRNGVEATADWTQTLKTEQARRLSGG